MSTLLKGKQSHQLEKKGKIALFSDHNGSLLRQQPGAMTIGHSPKEKAKPKLK